METHIAAILRAGIAAPSGENCQPWRFRINKNTIDLFNDPQADTSLYNFKQRASIIAGGAALENMKLEATAHKCDLKVSYFPDLANKHLLASLTVIPSITDLDPLQAHIFKRVTNRKKYQPVALSAEQLTELKQSAAEVGAGEVRFITESEKITGLAHSLSMNERIIFENKYLHNFFYDHIRWTDAEQKQNSTGFFVDTLELDPKQRKGFTLFKSWPILNILNKIIGVSKMIAKDNQANYQSAGGIGVIIFPGQSDLECLQAGRVLERLWLKATNMGLSLQPATGVIFLTQGVLAGDRSKFSKAQIKILETAQEDIQKMFGIEEEKIMMLFRVGQGGEPSARASRQPLDYFIS